MFEKFRNKGDDGLPHPLLMIYRMLQISNPLSDKLQVELFKKSMKYAMF